MEPDRTYLRYTYFIPAAELEELKTELHRTGHTLKEFKETPCAILNPRFPAALAAPAAWTAGFCKRRGSWFLESPRRDQYLLGLSFPLPGRGGTVIRASDFFPDRLPTRAEEYELIKSSQYQTEKPKEWENVSLMEIVELARGLKSMGTREVAALIKQGKSLGLKGAAKAVFMFKEIFVTNCANHANFMAPKYFVEGKCGIAPYSIAANTLYICSSCAEMFGIVGREYPFKFVVPCLGAALYGGLEVNRYYEVEMI